MLSISTGVGASPRKRGAPPPLVSTLQILANSDFEIPHTTQTDWVSSSGSWGGTSNPEIASDRLTFSYVERTVSQTVAVADYATYAKGTLELAVSRHGSKTDAQNPYHILIVFLDESAAQVATFRYPESGDANPNGADWFPVAVDFDLPQEVVVSISVQITGRDTGGWSGAYGPRFDYMRLTLSST